MIKRILFFSSIMLCAVYTQAMAIILPLNATPQQQSMWCWASSTQAIVRWMGGDVNQCTLANELRAAKGWGNDQCCNYGYFVLARPEVEGGPPICNQGNVLAGTGSDQELLSARGINTTLVYGPLPENQVQTELNAGRPFIFSWDWNTGGGHALVCRGQENGLVYYVDPSAPGNNTSQVNTYGWVRLEAHHEWVGTLRLNNSPPPPIPDVQVNGWSTTYYATSSTFLNVTIYQTDGLYAQTPADWWVLVSFSGMLYYLDQYGNWTTNPTTWSQLALQDRYATIYSGTLPSGIYTIYFGVDLTRNGILDDPIYYDWVNIVVQ